MGEIAGEVRRSKNRRADGTLKPTRARANARRNKRKRAEWLKNFDPAKRKDFFKHVDLERAVFLRGFAREMQLTEDEAWPYLERIAEDRRWRKLRTLTGRVVGIGPDKRAAA